MLDKPNGQVCIDTLVVYDGKYAPEDLGFKRQSNVSHIKNSDVQLNIDNCKISDLTPVVSQSRAASEPTMLKAQSVSIFSTNTNSYEFTDLQDGYVYTIRVRACLSDGRVSAWSAPVDVDYSTGISCLEEVVRDVTAGDASVYDISGRKVRDSSRPGIYIQNGKKVLRF